MVTKADDPSHKQKAIYSLTKKAIELLPVFAHIGAWGTRHLPVSEELSIRAKLLAEGGPSLWKAFMAELQEEHLGIPLPAGARHGRPTVRERLQAAFTEVPDGLAGGRSEERRDGKECVRTCRYRRSPVTQKKKK